MAKRAIPRDLAMAAPDVGLREREFVARVLEGSQLSGGPMLAEFEAGIARASGRRFGIGVSSGTAGLHVVVRALGIGPGSRVLTTAFSFVASVNCFLYEGAIPVFADIDPQTYCLAPGSVEDVAVSSQPIAALLPVHVFGQPSDMTQLLPLARRYGWPVIEDACEALGAEHAGQPSGSFGDAAVFAFYPNKQITTGEGGVVVTDDERIAAECRSLRNQGRGEGGDWLTHVTLGYNYRLDELSAAVGAAQLSRLTRLLADRADVASRYGSALARVRGIGIPIIAPQTTKMSWFVYVITLDRAIDRDAVAKRLGDDGVPTRRYFRPIHLQPYFRERFGDLRGSLPVTEDIGARTLALPFHGALSDDSIAYVVDALERAILA